MSAIAQVTTYAEAVAAIAAQLDALRRAAVGGDPATSAHTEPTETEDDLALLLFDDVTGMSVEEMTGLRRRFAARYERAREAARAYAEESHAALQRASVAYCVAGRETGHIVALLAASAHAADEARAEAREAGRCLATARAYTAHLDRLARSPGVASCEAPATVREGAAARVVTRAQRTLLAELREGVHAPLAHLTRGEQLDLFVLIAHELATVRFRESKIEPGSTILVAEAVQP